MEEEGNCSDRRKEVSRRIEKQCRRRAALVRCESKNVIRKKREDGRAIQQESRRGGK